MINTLRPQLVVTFNNPDGPPLALRFLQASYRFVEMESTHYTDDNGAQHFVTGFWCETAQSTELWSVIESAMPDQISAHRAPSALFDRAFASAEKEEQMQASTPDDPLYSEAIALRELLIARATGNSPSKTEYERLRWLFLERKPELTPGFVRDCDHLDAFWDFIKQDQFGGYRERRNYLRTEFLPLVNSFHAGTSAPTANRAERTPVQGDEIFLVHGHDTGALHATARAVLQLCQRDVIVLREQANRGRTVIEKLLDHAAEAGFAIVLLTADDTGGPKESDQRQPRARQNVVLELGLFLGLVGRDNVVVLFEQGVELPSDFAGVCYVLYDSAGAWRVELARELAAAGYPVDANRLR